MNTSIKVLRARCNALLAVMPLIEGELQTPTFSSLLSDPKKTMLADDPEYVKQLRIIANRIESQLDTAAYQLYKIEDAQSLIAENRKNISEDEPDA